MAERQTPEVYQKEEQAQTARRFRKAVEHRVQKRGGAYMPDSLVHETRTFTDDNIIIEYLRFNPEKVGDPISINEIMDKNEFFDATKVPECAIVINDLKEKTRTTFALQPDDTIERTHVVDASHEHISALTGPGWSHVDKRLVAVTGTATPSSTEALFRYIDNPQINIHEAARKKAIGLTAAERELITRKEKERDETKAFWEMTSEERVRIGLQQLADARSRGETVEDVLPGAQAVGLSEACRVQLTDIGRKRYNDYMQGQKRPGGENSTDGLQVSLGELLTIFSEIPISPYFKGNELTVRNSAGGQDRVVNVNESVLVDPTPKGEEILFEGAKGHSLSSITTKGPYVELQLYRAAELFGSSLAQGEKDAAIKPIIYLPPEKTKQSK